MKNWFQKIAFLGLALLLLSGSCEKDNVTNNTEKTVIKPLQPKPLIGNSDYDKDWRTVDSLDRRGLQKSALELVNAIMTRAQKDQDQPQQIKALFYQFKYQQILEEDGFVKALQQIDTLRKTNQEPLKQILASAKAEMLWSYFQNNRYRFYNRSTTANFDLGDVTTWDLKTLLNESQKLYMTSLENKEALQHISLKDYNYILAFSTEEGFESTPTVFDFLAHRALRFFKNDETGITRPADKFVVNDQRFFGTNTDFKAISTETEDTLSNLVYYVRTMQELVRFHANTNFVKARVRNTLERLKFAYSKTTVDLKTDWYEKALLREQQRYASNPIVAEINAQLVELYIQLNQNTTPQDVHYGDAKKAHQLCEETIKQYTDSYGAKLCENLKLEIENKSIDGNIEAYVSADKPTLVQVEFTNVSQMHVFVYSLKDEKKSYSSNLYDRVKDLKMIQSKKITLPKTDDFNNHTTEFALESLSYGKYILVYSTDSTNLDKNGAVCWAADFQVTDLAFSSRNLSSCKLGVEVVNRFSGEPISKATVTISESSYNYSSRKYVYKKLGSYWTDDKGWVVFPHTTPANYANRQIEVQIGNDKISSSVYLQDQNPPTQTIFDDYLFTDRAIYRPGQIVYFKGIRLERKDKVNKIASNQSVKVTFKDANYQDVKELTLTSNEYGSYSGSFQIPSFGLTGQMTLQTNRGSVNFSVEEYKRPTFKVNFITSKEEFKLGDNIKINGNATAYAGNAIDGAQVSYVVKRSFYLPYWYAYRYRIAPFSQEATIILQGTTKTDEKGQFTVAFDALKDASKDYKGLNYNYTIEAVVTDPNGETRTATKYIMLSDYSLQLNVTAENWDKSTQNFVTVSGTNSEGENIPIKGEIRIYPLKPKTQGITVERSWKEPDMPLLSKDEFHKLFPHLEYTPTSEMDREKEANVKVLNFNTANSKDVKIDVSDWAAGDYIIETTTVDKNGKEVRNEQFVKLTDAKSIKAQPGEILFAQIAKKTFEPGETIQMSISSALENQLVLMEVNVDGVIVESRNLMLKNEQKAITFKVEEKHRGGISFHFTTIKYGQSFSQDIYVNVPYSNKDLQVSFETFRDKLTPGEPEEWRLRISGPKKEKVAAEMLITMYDASLDAFRNHGYSFNPYRYNYGPDNRYFSGFGLSYGRSYYDYSRNYAIEPIAIPELNWFDYYSYYRNFRGSEMQSLQARSTSSKKDKTTTISREEISGNANYVEDETAFLPPVVANDMVATGEVDGDQTKLAEGQSNAGNDNTVVPLRSNFNETAFFFPQLKTDENGDILVRFTAPESLTSWKVMGLAHTKELQFAVFQKEVVTQKELMVQTNLPRFIRSGDEVFLTAKVSNLTDGTIGGTAKLQVFDALTMKDVSREFNLTAIYPDFNIEGKQSAVVTWRINAPEGINSLVLRVSAKAGNHTDGEELTLPVLTDKVLVTESMPLTNNGIGAKEFVFEKLVNSGTSTTLKQHSVTLEYTSNPAWYVIQALPYMMEYPHDCSEQIFTRFYANSIASNIVRSSPKIKAVMEQWKNSSPDAFLSNLEKNQQLKSVVLEETPWVMDAKNESERKKRVALLFDFNKMDNELAKNLKQLEAAQVSNGGFSWFPGMPENRYITQRIVSGMGHLNALGIVAVKDNKDVQRMIQKAVKYLDARILEDYNNWKKYHKDGLYNYAPTDLQYLYARSFFSDIKFSKDEQEAVDFYRTNAEKNWLNFNLSSQTMLALSSFRNGNVELANTIMKSVLERSITTEEMGMYWKENESGYYWYQAPIETQALLIEAIQLIQKDQQAVNNAKIWMLRNKQTTDWKTTTATADACYALLFGGNSFVEQSGNVKIEINGKEIKPEDFGSQVEAGTGYFQATWTGKEIAPELGKVKVTRQTEGFSWGAMYWQYFESMDKVTSATTNLQLKKQLFVVRQTNAGEIIVPINDGDELKRGDKVRVRIELKTDRDMEFVHMKDYRAAGFEPINVLSRYKWQDGLGYYESTKDVATHFFFDYLRKGNYVFEYDMYVSHSGDFSNGFATIECMYAPEFKSHSNGVRVKIR